MIKPIKVYLCGPINGCTDAEAKNWREAVKEHLYSLNCVVCSVDPMKRDYREIVELDKRDIRGCDIILVNYDKPSVGTSMEVFYAWTLGIPIVVWHAPDAKLSPWLIYHSTSLVTSLDEAVAKLREII